ncbi:exonuclease domain-containing protein [Evansella cellulosilytica]|uniref:Exonuclease RNase T and DNA polymerase III n=1 Tax=Evansella cellulosilytica (strain ATCC 21833 / DSM 2522 / FERM P-1141 / JCM 9156 / N-4) TaxID=649639 RepID=E6U0W4_EVAC2|nr:exonuclease domain-containing protein [Evansella cellulosilytica]ADU30276.1 Exonuclease RNase T and DNA polymerase III [Evansella cellulosilytica DSM 2522]
MNPMIQFLKQISGKLSFNQYSSVMGQSDAKQIAYIRALQREHQRENVLEIPFSKLDVVVFDLETTGFYPNNGDRILSIGGIKVKGDKVIDSETFYSLINSNGGVSEEITKLTNITEKDLIEAPPINDVLQNFYTFMSGCTLVAHHANHERSFMQHMTWSILKSRFEHRIIDTAFLTKIVEPNKNLVSLDECCDHYGITIKKRHHALYDAIATAQLWTESVREIQNLGFQHLKDVYTHLATLK